MGKVMTGRGFTIRELKNGLFSVKYAGFGFETKPAKFVGTWNEAGSWVFEMSNNSAEGRLMNHRMCKAFGRVFLSEEVW